MELDDCNPDLFSPFLDRLHQSQPVDLRPSLCAWSDLLGFGTPFFESDWEPSPDQWTRLVTRVDDAYRIHLRYWADGYILCLNDGIVRALVMDMPDRWVGRAALWMRFVALAHAMLNKAERDLSLPGARTIVSAGTRAEYAFGEVREDDLVLRYTRSPGRHSSESRGENRTVVSNPAPLQLNTAFSKAYLLDQLGSAHGLGGPGFFVDESVFGVLREWSKGGSTFPYAVGASSLRMIEERRGPHWFFGLQDTPLRPDVDGGLFGFLCDSPPIAVQTPRLTPAVHRVVKYFTDDENWSEFSIDLS